MLCQVTPVLDKIGVPSDQHYQLVISATLPALGFTQLHLMSGNNCPLSTLNTFHYSINNKLVCGGSDLPHSLPHHYYRVFPREVGLGSDHISLSTNHFTASFSLSSGLLLTLSDVAGKVC